MKLAVVTPSYLNSTSRVELAEASLRSLAKTVLPDTPHIVVNDFPRGAGRFTRWFPNLKWRNAGRMIYNQPNVTFIQRMQRGSTSALLEGVQVARRQGVDLIFIHLDDNVYSPNMATLIKFACEAFASDPELLTVLFSSHPLISRHNIPEGNRKFLEIDNDKVTFESAYFQPTRFEAFTLWWSYYRSNFAKGNFWPIAMWTTIYRSDFLESLLTFETVPKLKWLGQVEKYYKNEENLQRLIKTSPGKVGFINMQFGGLEMHRNKDWKDLLDLPNIAVR